jgi:hypothetical protein
MRSTRKDVSWIGELPAAGNEKLQMLLDHVGRDNKLHQLWRVANVMVPFYSMA